MDRSRIWLQALQRAYDEANAYYLRSALTAPTLCLSEGVSRLGSWHPDTREIRIARALLEEGRWEQVIEVLRHEMAHQYVSEVLRPVGETAHGPAFRQAADRLGVDPVAAGLSSVEAQGSPVLRKVHKLLALAGSDNEHEAERAMAKAQALILRHNLSLGPDRTYTSRIIGPRKRRFQRWEKGIMGLLARHFFVRVMWIPIYLPERDVTGRAAEVMGTPENLDLAEHVHGFLTASGKRLWATWSTTRTRKDRRDKRSYLIGLLQGFEQRLERQRRTHEEQGLVWVEDADLAAFERRRYPRQRQVRASATRVTGAYQAGRVAGQELVLHKPITHQGRRNRLLGYG